MEQSRGRNEKDNFTFTDRYSVKRGYEKAGAKNDDTVKNDERDKMKKSSVIGEPDSGIRGFIKRWANPGTPDVMFIFIVLGLLAIGLVMMFSASYTYAYYDSKTGHDALYYIKRQGIFAAVGVVLMFIISKINYKRLNGGLAIIGYAGTFLLLAFTLIINIKKDNDFKRWIRIGPLSFQPSEIAKFALVLMIAYVTARQYGVIESKGRMRDGYLSDFDKRTMSWVRAKFYRNASTKSFALTCIYALLIIIMCGMIMLERHLSCTILVFLIGVSMMWLSGVKKGYFVILALVIALAVAIVIMHPDILPKYAAERIIAWKDKAYDPLGSRWQTNQSLRAIASGGPFGLGLGNSRQKHMYVSEPQNDFIFAIVCEELGFVGAGAIICLFGALVWRAFRIAEKSSDVFGSMLAMGIALQVGLQVFLNIAVVTDMFPNTGISLPFFSYGGTSLTMLLCEMGVILSISKQNSLEKQKRE